MTWEQDHFLNSTCEMGTLHQEPQTSSCHVTWYCPRFTVTSGLLATLASTPNRLVVPGGAGCCPHAGFRGTISGGGRGVRYQASKCAAPDVLLRPKTIGDRHTQKGPFRELIKRLSLQCLQMFDFNFPFFAKLINSF